MNLLFFLWICCTYAKISVPLHEEHDVIDKFQKQVIEEVSNRTEYNTAELLKMKTQITALNRKIEKMDAIISNQTEEIKTLEKDLDLAKYEHTPTWISSGVIEGLQFLGVSFVFDPTKYDLNDVTFSDGPACILQQ